MLDPETYQLIDFGQGRKLESFAGCLVDRETPSAEGYSRQLEHWPHEALSYQRQDRNGCWTGTAPESWNFHVGHSSIQLELRTTPSGQVGVFPEQAVNWDWILNSSVSLEGRKAINLFGYTGATTLALASRGAHVSHVDAARSVVNWARSNAANSSLSQAPIRWIVEDAARFVQREIKRGNRYDILVADPPSFGRGPGGEVWKLERDLPMLLADLAKLASEDLCCLLLSCHTPGIGVGELNAMCRQAFSRCVALNTGSVENLQLKLTTASGHCLPSGVCFRWSRSDNASNSSGA